MEHLLRWGIQNSGAGDGDGQNSSPNAQPRKDLDPAILDHILGRPDSELMKEALSQASDEEQSEKNRVAALDDLEMAREPVNKFPCRQLTSLCSL